MNQRDLAIAKRFASDNHTEALELLRSLARIPAPSHHEELRAGFVCDWMQSNGLVGAYIDEANNVICPIADDGTAGLIVFAAHTDVVFPDTDELPLTEHDGRMYAPGVGDDTANLVALLLAARELARHKDLIPPSYGVLIVANSCEEGLGNLAGTRRLFAAYGSRIRRFYSFDLYLPQCISTAVGSHRWQVTVRTQGGHSFHDFGKPNAIERLCAIIREFYDLAIPCDATTTLNVGTIEGGTTVNAIAAHARATIEYRSISDGVLQRLRTQLHDLVTRYASEDVEIELSSIGERPASASGTSPELERMKATSYEIIRSVTGQEPDTSPASTDANIPLSQGIPANTIGAVRGALLHTRDEWIDTMSLREGLAVVMGLMLAQAELS